MNDGIQKRNSGGSFGMWEVAGARKRNTGNRTRRREEDNNMDVGNAREPQRRYAEAGEEEEKKTKRKRNKKPQAKSKAIREQAPEEGAPEEPHHLSSSPKLEHEHEHDNKCKATAVFSKIQKSSSPSRKSRGSARSSGSRYVPKIQVPTPKDDADASEDVPVPVPNAAETAGKSSEDRMHPHPHASASEHDQLFLVEEGREDTLWKSWPNLDIMNQDKPMIQTPQMTARETALMTLEREEESKKVENPKKQQSAVALKKKSEEGEAQKLSDPRAEAGAAAVGKPIGEDVPIRKSARKKDVKCEELPLYSIKGAELKAFFVGFPEKKYLFMLIISILTSFLNSWLLKQLLEAKEMQWSCVLFFISMATEVHKLIIEEVLLAWEASLLNLTNKCFLAAPKEMTIDHHRTQLLEPQIVDSVSKFVHSMIDLTSKFEHVVEVFMLSIFLLDFKQLEFSRGIGSMFGYMILGTILIVSSTRNHLKSESVLMDSSKALRHSVVSSRHALNNRSLPAGSHISYHVDQVHHKEHEYIHAMHTFLGLRFWESFFHHAMDRSILIWPLLSTEIPFLAGDANTIYAAVRLCRRVDSIVAKVPALMRSATVSRQKLDTWLKAPKVPYAMSSTGKESKADSKPVQKDIWGQWHNVIVGYTSINEFKPANDDEAMGSPLTRILSVRFRGWVWIPIDERGKTTIMNTICGAIPPLQGEVDFAYPHSVEMLADTSHNFIVGSLVDQVMHFKKSPAHVHGDKASSDEALAMSCIKKVNLFPDRSISWLRSRGVGHLSTEERQKLHLARMLFCEPAVLFLDNALYALNDEDAGRIYTHLREAVNIVVSVGPERVKAYHDNVFRPSTGSLQPISK